MTDALSRLRTDLAALVQLDAIPERQMLPLRRARIVGQVGDLVSLQLVDRDKELPDAGQEARQPIWYGVPGISATHTPGQETMLAFGRGDPTDPIVFLCTPRGQPGHVPILVRHEAITEIRLVAESAGVVRAGPGATQPVALGPALDSLIAALATFAAGASIAGPATTAAQIAAAAATLGGALAAIAPTKAIKLEAI